MNWTQLDSYSPEKVRALFGLTQAALSELLEEDRERIGVRSCNNVYNAEVKMLYSKT